MKYNVATHSERVRTRNQLNGKPYPDNPKGLPYNNKGTLVKPSYERNNQSMNKND